MLCSINFSPIGLKCPNEEPVDETSSVQPARTRPSLPPKLIAINHDEYHAAHIGRTPDGRQFFLTTPFIPASQGDKGREFIALYLFDAEGCLLDAQIDHLGPRTELDPATVAQRYAQRLAALGPVSYERIEVQPFQIECFGKAFGLVLCQPEDDDNAWWVEAQPGNYMAFAEPFDSGEYDT